MKTHGLIVADNGSDMYVQGTYDTRWDTRSPQPCVQQPQWPVTSRSSSWAGALRPLRRAVPLAFFHAAALPGGRHPGAPGVSGAPRSLPLRRGSSLSRARAAFRAARRRSRRMSPSSPRPRAISLSIRGMPGIRAPRRSNFSAGRPGPTMPSFHSRRDGNRDGHREERLARSDPS